MCENGVNYTQIKIAFHQLIEANELLEKNISQWKNIADLIGNKHLSNYVENSKEKTAEARDSLKKAFSEVSHLSTHHHHKNEVTISKV
ncbi:hypothetical protein [Candidatus Oleimmundimicrobium sp.]|uniref:hypothetical protein n=1 Tax=Candidatus Oleimmundimicrobium sp. TaxID=3060597 RepID=UPI00271E6C7E|nr:hypothetical protein [Candidatus Oleimmundimicrobium sp.]MDO8885675.1 hypothetical protein [Candidatus Oleimmundimicrobium sp.]